MRRAVLVLLAALAGCGGGAEPRPASGGQAALLEAGDAGDAAAQAGIAPPQAGTAPPQAGTAPQQAGTAPPQAGTAPQQAGTAPPQAATAPQAGTRPPQGGRASPQSGAGAVTPQRRATAAPGGGAPLVRGRYATARLTGRVALRAAPGGRAVGGIGPRTQFGGRRVVSVLRRRGAWLQVVVPERPNARPGWIAAGRARLGGTNISLHIDRSDRTLVVRDGDRVLRRAAIGVGSPYHPTPTGRFAVTDKLKMGGPGTTYGCCAIALSAHQPNLPQTWNGLDRIAVHGTQSPETIGTASSLGCMHASDRDLRRLMRIVPLGAPVFLRA